MTLAQLLRRLAREVVELLGENLELAKAEMAAKLRFAAIAVACLILALLLSVAVLATLTACLVLALALVVPPWLAALIVTAAYLLVTIAALVLARANIVRAFPPAPSEAIRQFKENLQWAKVLTTSNRR